MDKEIESSYSLHRLLDEHYRILGNTLTELLHRDFPLSGPRSLVDGEQTEGRLYLTVARYRNHGGHFTIRLTYNTRRGQKDMNIGSGRIISNKESHVFLDNIKIEDLPEAYGHLSTTLSGVLAKAGFGVTLNE